MWDSFAVFLTVIPRLHIMRGECHSLCIVSESAYTSIAAGVYQVIDTVWTLLP